MDGTNIGPLRVLLIEDNPDDAELVTETLGGAGLEITVERVETEASLRASLSDGAWDIVLSDHRLPGFSGPRALRIVRELGLDLPFILVSGAIGEESAVACMKAGANDYVMKGKLDRLPSAVEREVREVRARRLARRERRRSEALARTVIDSMPDCAVFVFDHEMRYHLASGKALRAAGYADEAIVGKTMRQVLPPERADALAPLYEAALAGERQLAVQTSGERTDEIRTAAIRGADGAVELGLLAVRDVTARQQAEQTLRQSEERLALAIAASGQGLWDWDIASDETYMSPEYWRMVGYTEGEVRADMAFFQSLVHPDDADHVATTMQAHLQGDSAQSEIEYRMRTRSGDYIWVYGIGRVTARDATGAPTRMVGVVQDISGRKRAEQALRESEGRYRALFDNAPIGLGVADTEGNILAFNQAMITSGGRTPEDVAQIRHVVDLYADPSDRARVLEIFRARGSVDREEVDFKRKDGSRYANLLTLRPVVIGGQQGVLAMMEDISERRHLEAQMRAAQKMDALGRLAGGIAHDFNNLLMVIISYAGFVRDALPHEDPRRDDIAELLRAADNAASLTQQLLVFSRRSKIEPILVDLNALVLNLDKMLRRLIGEHLELVILPGAGVMTVRVSPGQLEQVIVNLAVNARDAMSTGGTLTIALSGVVRQEGDRAAPPGLPPGAYVRLRVRDTGCGMDRETQERIFEPFFTTKEAGKGTGLGLATCYGIVKQFDGQVLVDSNPGQGTTFDVYLPRIEGDHAPRPTDSVPATHLPGSETVLVVEDKRAVRQLIVRALRRWGYQVLQAENGEAALAVVRAHVGSIDLLLSDVVMPKMSGTELAARFREARPGARVLLMSGYTDEEANRHGVLESGHSFLQKPFVPNILVQRVREILDAGPVTAGK